ncbi:hypothetical protein [Flexivirga oryzae]|uniref:Uncharacterized protein n=1 Tax=Flexivirga oryzae TaxID=1794944 RepID=A0A839N0H8_9MICO|nr:hypothetical protein [Flexivirga oryzae]MBB2890339.1 hypothetical protein [Flexivirga oryzae]
MTVEQLLRDQFDRAAEGLPGPDLDAVLTGGRRHRRRRTVAYTTGTVVAVAAVAAAAVPLVHAGRSADTPKPAGQLKHLATANPVGERMQASVAAAAPELPAPYNVYPSDWNRNTPLPADQAANATEWQLYYHLSNGETLLVYTTLKLPGQPEASCEPKDKTCHTTQVDGGTLMNSRQQLLDQQTLQPTSTQFLSTFVAGDGSLVNVFDTVPDPDASAAAQQRSLTDDQLNHIATADGLTVPAPAVTPPPPTEP